LFAGVVLIFAFPLIWVDRARLPSMWPLLLAMLAVLLVGYWLMKRVLFDLVDEVFDNGDALLVKNRDQEERVSLSDIAEIRYGSLFNPLRVTLSLKRPSIFGVEIAFLRPAGFPLVGSAAIRDLTKRIDAQRTG
jgi:hypothetical protein